MSAQPQPTRYYGEAEKEAFGIVLDAIEDAMDVNGLDLWFRGRLAMIHGKVAWHVGEEPVLVPDDWKPAAPLTDWERAREPGGVDHLKLREYASHTALIRGGFVTIEQVAAASDEDLLALSGIGAKRLRAIRAAIERYHAEQRTGAVR